MLAQLTQQQLVESDIFDLLHLQNASDEVKDQFATRVLEGVENRVLLRIFDLLKEDNYSTWVSLLDTGDDEMIRKFLTESDIDMQMLTIEESFRLKQELVEKFAKE